MNQLTAVLIVTIGILGGFYVGAKYGQGHPPPSSTVNQTAARGTGAGTRTGTGGGGGFGGGGGAALGGNATAGAITAVNGDTITIHNPRTNTDVKVNVSSARITKTTDGTPADLTQNTNVTVVGQAGSDGTVTATTIVVGTVPGFGRAAPSPSPSAGS